MSAFLVTATPPTPNGDLHVGHLSGPYLAADIFTRYQRMRGNEVIYLCSADDHQSYVMTTASRRAWEPAKLVEHYTQTIKGTLRAAQIEIDLFPSALGNSQHIAFVQSFFKSLYEQGILVTRQSKGYYCRGCARHLFESFVKGRCPYCGEGAAGNLCEACGRVNDPIELIDPTCSLCHARPETVERRGLYLPLERYRSQLAEFYASRSSWRPHLRALCRWLVAHPLPDYPISYPTSWGIPVPVEGMEGQAINVWAEMYPGHIATTRALGAVRDDPGLADRLWGGGATLVQFLGYDNSFFNAVLHVALGLAAGRRYALPEHIITNEFYLLSGEKFSTSRNHAIWGSDILQKVQADVLRHYLCRTNPEHMQTSFSMEHFAAQSRQELSGNWSGLINAFLEHIHSQNRGVIPATPELDLQARGLLGWAREGLERFYGQDAFSLLHASATLQAYVEGCRDYLERSVLTVTEKKGPGYSRRLGSLAYLIKGLAYLCAPMMPVFAQQLWAALGNEGQVGKQLWSELEAPLSAEKTAGPAREWFAIVSP